MTNNENEIRAQFEAWAKERGYINLRKDGDKYKFQTAWAAWEGWQASRQALVIDLPSVQCIRINDYTAEETREACRRAIESQGVKCK
ncbi:hypothetical protein G169_gp56 [Pseudomonas phage AF]|uniref:hypothetical protein n=1 Tax=Pseudomonas phage AF TaxID=1235689 RepID=UPI00029718B0|nr:hypothetical protein G169_gp56 [Pseudomonas phage AF]AFV50669.1 hypothetical protein AF_056 [Pseudomonas phage AF]